MQIIMGWFSNRTGASIDDGEHKSNNRLYQRRVAINWAPEVTFSPFRKVSCCQLTFPFCCWISLLALTESLCSNDMRCQGQSQHRDNWCTCVCLEYGWIVTIQLNHWWDIHFISFWNMNFCIIKYLKKNSQFFSWIFIWSALGMRKFREN